MSPIVYLAVAVAAAPSAPDAAVARGSVLLFQDARDPEATRSAEPLGELRDWLSAAAFPASAFARDTQAVLYIHVAVDPAGRVASCEADPMMRDADPALAARTCALIRQRGRFRHAIDADGRPVASTLRLSAWFAPPRPGGYAGPPPAPPAPPSAGWGTQRPVPRDPAALVLPADRAQFAGDTGRVVVDVDAKGRATRCQLLVGGGSDAGDAAVCRRLRATRFEPARAGGRKVAYPGLVLTLRRER